MHVELKFPLTGHTLPTDQGYALYGAIARLVPEIHSADWFALETIPGIARGDGTTQLDPHGKLRMRLPQEHVALWLKLAGKQLRVNDQTIRLGAPEISLLEPSAALYARIVTIKGFTEPEPFTDAVCRKLEDTMTDTIAETNSITTEFAVYQLVGTCLTKR
jgi:CRISPR-associated endonuclease/helicase Cas3